MSVIGIDFGNESCYVAVAKAGGIETIANDYSLRATPSCVAFTGNTRTLGVAAKNQQVTNLRNTVCGFKHFLGRKFKDPVVQNELQSTLYRVEERPDGSVGIRVDYMGEEQVFTPEQITAMLLTKLKVDATSELKTQIYDCVITVPSYFTNAERKALLDAAGIAGLNCLRLINETTATALNYGFYKQDLPEPEEKSRNVVFVDFGHSAIQVSACAFNKGKLKMLAATSDLVGGRDVDMMLAEHFRKEFMTKYKLDPRSNKKSFLRLLTEVEKLKKQMSANSTKLPLNIECFMNDVDVQSSIQRVDMEELCKNLFQRIEDVMKRCLRDSKLTLDEIHSVEIVGGSSRIPAVKHLIEQIFGKTSSTTINQDEAVSRGGALQCAILSPAVRVRDFSVTDIQPYSVMITFDNENGQRSDMEVFPANHAVPFSRLLTMARRDSFAVKLYYADPSPCLDPFVGEWKVNDVKPSSTGDAQEVKVKVRINHNGILLISSAQMVEKREVQEEQQQNGSENDQATAAAAQQPSPDATPSQTPSGEPMDTSGQEGASSDDDVKSPTKDTGNEKTGWTHRISRWFSSDDKKKKKSNKVIELPIVSRTHGYSQVEFDKYFELEGKMISNDRQEMERVDARNALEEFVYDMREKLQYGGNLYDYIEDQIRDQICRQLDDMENWLYEDGASCEREMYRTRLNELQQKTDPIKNRQTEYEGHQQAFNELGHAIQMSYKAVAQYRGGDPKYDHLTETEMLNITEQADKSKRWFEEARGKLSTLKKTQDPPIKIADVRHEYNTITTCVNSVLNRPKPRPATPPPAKTEAPQNGSQEQSTEETNDQNKSGEVEMDVE
ncbi:CLUMA_CG009967, isoform A [Clunio marinus]|uniref:CLUMA_CG009967, isoform A n=1 Tax=Clunio marinus TaxID=568069 RepID=A0A1J1I8A9_9DIPT|nr:CLUMA_CG009967, isoform A [Clunio marinus]